ncbi:hypothetical protein BaRGS_00009364 [Batillaria attramentaria]|uniref:Uncharacterized protein n=1 Tax=Batillaria attramentaria TaxID=370345 RepID=A0ABD0LKB7_9CAEN
MTRRRREPLLFALRPSEGLSQGAGRPTEPSDTKSMAATLDNRFKPTPGPGGPVSRRPKPTGPENVRYQASLRGLILLSILIGRVSGRYRAGF